MEIIMVNSKTKTLVVNGAKISAALGGLIALECVVKKEAIKRNVGIGGLLTINVALYCVGLVGGLITGPAAIKIVNAIQE
jgi:hypothetical protein